MNTRIGFLSIGIVSLSSVCVADNKAYLGVGLSNLELDGANSVNFSITAGHDIRRWKFQSAKIHALDLAIEGQYADSLSGMDDVKHYSIFAATRVYTSDRLYFKIKQGFTDFPDVTLTNADAEHSHISAGIGLGYKIDSGSLELEYLYPNKTIHASLFEISYKLHF